MCCLVNNVIIKLQELVQDNLHSPSQSEGRSIIIETVIERATLINLVETPRKPLGKCKYMESMMMEQVPVMNASI